MSEKPNRLILYSGVVGNHDGAYDIVKESDYDLPENTLGFHDSVWPEDRYTVVELANPSLQAEVERLKQGMLNLYRRVPVEEGQMVQFVGVHAVEWKVGFEGPPKVAFLEVDDEWIEALLSKEGEDG